MKYWKRILPLLLVLAMLTGIMLPAAALEAEATLSLNEEVSVTVEGEEVEIFAFVPEEDGLYAFFSTDCDGDPRADVLDWDTYPLAYDDDSGEAWNFRAIWYATAGKTYYLVAAGYGNYTVSVERITCDSISLNETVSVEPSKLFSFVPEKDGVYVFSSADGENDPQGCIYDSNMNEIASDDDSGEDWNFRILWYATAGETYFLKAGGYGVYDVSLSEGMLAESVTLDRTSFSGDAMVNNYIQLTPVFYPENSYCKSVSWSSSDESVASVDEYGDVYLCGLGTAVITATTDSGLQASCTVTVNEIDSITLGEVISLDVANGRTCYAYTPTEDGWYRFYSEGDLDSAVDVYDQDINYIKSDDSSGEDENFRLDCFMNAGQTYYLFARIYDWGQEGACQVQMVKSPAPTGLAIERDFFSGIVGETITIFCNPLPEDACLGELTWTVSDESVAMITDSWQNFVVLSLLRDGTVTVTATADSGHTASSTLRVNEVKDINCGDTVIFDAENGRQEFRFVPEESGPYMFRCDGGVEEAFGYIWDSNMANIGEGSSYDDGSFVLVAWLEAGEEYRLGIGCYEDTGSGTCTVYFDKAVAATGIQLSQTEIKGEPGDAVQLSATLVPNNAFEEYISWESSDYDVADVDSEGYVYLYGAGTAVITATTERGLSASCTVTVDYPEAQQLQCNQPVTVTETESDTWFSFVPQTSGWYRFFTQGDNVDPRGDLFDQNRYELDSADDNTQDYNFTLGYEMTAGQTYYLRLKFYDVDGSDSCTLTVEEMVYPTGVSMDLDTYTGYVGEHIGLYAAVEPYYAVEKVTWSSSDKSVAYVYPDGEVELRSLGTATITATTVNGLQATCVISVVEPTTINLGDTVTLNAEQTEVRFRFVPEEDGRYGFYTTGVYDTYGVLYDSQGELLVSDDDGALEYNYMMRYELKAGQEYVVISTFYNPYNLRPGTYEFHVEQLKKAQQIVPFSSTMTVYEDYYIYLDCVFLPLPSELEQITWTSSDESVVWIEDEYYALAMAPGNVVLNGTSESGLTTTIAVEVVEHPDDSDAAGQCGYNLLWYLKDGVLTITGSGDMFAEYQFEFDINEVQFPEGITSIASYAFWRQNIETVTIPAAVTEIGNEAFFKCNIGQLRFQGSAPEIAEDAFTDVTTTAYYPAGDPTWTQAARQNYGGDITWVAYGSGGTTGATLSGSFTTGAEGNVTLELVGNNTSVRKVVSGKTGTYSFENVAAGTYTLRVSKDNHVTREYTVTVGSNAMTQDVKICLLGDVDGNGRINVGDISKLLSHIRGTALLTDEYLLECANANGGKLNMGDISAIYAHIKGTKTLY